MEEQVWDQAEELYKLVWNYYMFQISCITREDYERMQQSVGYTENYLQHMKRLTHGIPNDASRMVRHIMRFLTDYPEFQEEKYSHTITRMIDGLKSNPEAHKLRALEALMKHISEREPGERSSEEITAHPPLFETMIGTKKFVLPTYGNPMMTALYSLLFVCFAKFAYAEMEAENPAGEHEYI
jgi:hypothetical protein